MFFSLNFLLQTLFEKSAAVLTDKYPDVFPRTEFTYNRFKFSWLCIQARAFGRRLPWTALVPFADCLNHTNVQTKYDFNVDGNKMFRLFPSGANHYSKGNEVFNSYGRRPNDNLLMDYGFALLDNEWDEVCSYSVMFIL
jgi:histone-lysine N-methyltransferase SETD3